jgi:hypothetical protein
VYKLIIRKYAQGWTWRFFRNNLCIAKSGKGYVNHYNARRSFSSFKHHHAREDYTIEIVKSNRKVP